LAGLILREGTCFAHWRSFPRVRRSCLRMSCCRSLSSSSRSTHVRHRVLMFCHTSISCSGSCAVSLLSVPAQYSMHARHCILTCCPASIFCTGLCSVFRINVPHMHVLSVCDHLSIHTMSCGNFSESHACIQPDAPVVVTTTICNNHANREIVGP
jgi:hypothetical protein